MSASTRTLARIPALATLLVALTGCKVGPTYEPPPLPDAPAAWGRDPSDVPSRIVRGGNAGDAAWWHGFRDPELSSLVDRLAARNLDLKTAAERILQGRAQRQVVASQGLPQIDGQSLDYWNRASPNGIQSLFTPSPGSRPEFGLFQQGLQASWELDLFGRVRNAVEAQDATILASVEDRHAIAVSALADLAQSYLQLRGTQTRIAIATANVRLAEDNIVLVRTRFSQGVANTLDIAQSRSQQATITETLPLLRTQEAQLINAIGFLLGEAPRALEAELRSPKALPRVPRLVPVGLPGTIVRQRPDVREAEARLHAATAQTGVAVANFYPKVTLNGLVNAQSVTLAKLFSPHSLAYDVGPSISIPIFEGGRLRGDLKLRESQQREAAIAFQRTVLQSWQEVDNALTAYTEAQHRRVAAARAVAENEIALRAARQRYTEGLVDFLNVNSTQAQLLQSRNDLADNDVRITTDLVALYRALGGGWEIVDGPSLDSLSGSSDAAAEAR